MNVDIRKIFESLISLSGEKTLTYSNARSCFNLKIIGFIDKKEVPNLIKKL